MRKAGSVKAFSAFFMCPVSHTFPAYNGNVMPRRVSTGDACAPFYGLRKLFFLCGLLRQFARGRGMISPQCPGTPRVKPTRKIPVFSEEGGQSLFYGLRFSANLFFSCGVLRGCVGVEGAFPLWWCSILSQGGKAASPASGSPWRTPTNRSRTRLFSAPNSPAFRGSQQPLVAFPLEEPGVIFPHPAARIDKEKGPWYNVHDPTWVALVFACWLAQGLFSCHQAAPGRMTRDGR